MPPNGGWFAELVPWQGCVSLRRDPWSQEVWLTHNITHERAQLPDTAMAEVVFSGDGGGAVIFRRVGEEDESGEGDVVLLDSLFRQLLYRSPEGEELIAPAGGGAPEAIHDIRGRSEMLQITLKCGAQALECNIAAAWMQEKTFFGCRARWSLHDLYDALGLK